MYGTRSEDGSQLLKSFCPEMSQAVAAHLWDREAGEQPLKECAFVKAS